MESWPEKFSRTTPPRCIRCGALRQGHIGTKAVRLKRVDEGVGNVRNHRMSIAFEKEKDGKVKKGRTWNARKGERQEKSSTIPSDSLP